MYFKRHLLTFQADVWDQLTDRWRDVLDFVELVDHPKARCFRVAFDIACAQGEWYVDRIGRRWGVPYDLWVIDPTIYSQRQT
jgi:hypothetical protein